MSILGLVSRPRTSNWLIDYLLIYYDFLIQYGYFGSETSSLHSIIHYLTVTRTG